MRDLKKDMKHAFKTAVLLATILMMTAATVGTTYADDNSTLGTTTTITSTARVNSDIFFRPDPFFKPNIFFNPFIRFNPFFGFDDDAFGFGFVD